MGCHETFRSKLPDIRIALIVREDEDNVGLLRRGGRGGHHRCAFREGAGCNEERVAKEFHRVISDVAAPAQSSSMRAETVLSSSLTLNGAMMVTRTEGIIIRRMTMKNVR